MRRSKLNFAGIVLSDVLRSGQQLLSWVGHPQDNHSIALQNAFQHRHSILTGWFQVLSRHLSSLLTLLLLVNCSFSNLWFGSHLSSFLPPLFTCLLGAGLTHRWLLRYYFHSTLSTPCWVRDSVHRVTGEWRRNRRLENWPGAGSSGVKTTAAAATRGTRGTHHFRPDNESSCHPVDSEGPDIGDGI